MVRRISTGCSTLATGVPMRAHTLGRGGPSVWLPVDGVEGLGVAVLQVGDEVVVEALHPVGHHLGLHAPARRAAQGREEGRDGHVQLLQHHANQFLHVGIALGVGHQHA